MKTNTTKLKNTARESALAELRELLRPGEAVFTIQTSVSKSGTKRGFRLYAMQCMDGKVGVRNITGLVSDVTGFGFDQVRGSLAVRGCGMDASLSVVYNLSYVLHPDGFGVNGQTLDGHKVRPATKEDAESAVNDGVVFFGRNGDPSGWDSAGGYALERVSLA